MQHLVAEMEVPVVVRHPGGPNPIAVAAAAAVVAAVAAPAARDHVFRPLFQRVEQMMLEFGNKAMRMRLERKLSEAEIEKVNGFRTDTIHVMQRLIHKFVRLKVIYGSFLQVPEAYADIMMAQLGEITLNDEIDRVNALIKTNGEVQELFDRHGETTFRDLVEENKLAVFAVAACLALLVIPGVSVGLAGAVCVGSGVITAGEGLCLALAGGFAVSVSFYFAAARATRVANEVREIHDKLQAMSRDMQQFRTHLEEFREEKRHSQMNATMLQRKAVQLFNECDTIIQEAHALESKAVHVPMLVKPQSSCVIA